ncbi:MAG: mechanosensitive ion channel [Burkholderiaceae bacterium]|nr:mechanosensitive ion channel [Rhodoferax sp.]MCB2041704.1 mechanosensitive ion channel [Rhodoferax sp.]MCP5262038.1 mechanosensitive ion channel [Rhodoferax sp.]
MNEYIDQLNTQLTALLATYGMNVLGAIVTLVVGFAAAGWLSRLTNRAMRKADKIDPVFQPLPGKVVRIAVIVFTVIAVLNRFGVQTTSLIAVLGAAGLAIGLALQGTLSNVAAGVMILVFRPFKIGDVVNLGGDIYIIDSLGFFICKAHLPDGPTAFLPNSKIWGETILNLSVTDKDIRRVDEHYGIGYGDDINKAIAILKQIAADESRILKDPAPLIKVDSLGDSSVNILFRVWTSRTDWWDTKLDLVQRCKEALEGGGISIPFPQRDVHLIGQAQAKSE